MEKAYELEFSGEKKGSLFVNCCGISRTEPFHSFGPAIKPHFVVHFVLSGKGKFSIGNKDYFLEAGYGFVIPPDVLTFYQADEMDPWTYVWVGFNGNMAEELMRDMGFSAATPIFKSDRDKEFTKAVMDI